MPNQATRSGGGVGIVGGCTTAGVFDMRNRDRAAPLIWNRTTRGVVVRRFGARAPVSDLDGRRGLRRTGSLGVMGLRLCQVTGQLRERSGSERRRRGLRFRYFGAKGPGLPLLAVVLVCLLVTAMIELATGSNA